jgi:hypothetical protein
MNKISTPSLSSGPSTSRASVGSQKVKTIPDADFSDIRGVTFVTYKGRFVRVGGVYLIISS